MWSIFLGVHGHEFTFSTKKHEKNAEIELCMSLCQIEGFDVKHVDEYHLTGITLDMFVQWERRPPSSTDGRSENRNEAREEGTSKPEQKKAADTCCSEGKVSLSQKEPCQKAHAAF